MIHFDADNCTQIGTETELNIHAGTVRDVSFVSRPAGLPVLVSGGAGMPHVVCVCLCVCECVCVCVCVGGAYHKRFCSTTYNTVQRENAEAEIEATTTTTTNFLFPHFFEYYFYSNKIL